MTNEVDEIIVQVWNGFGHLLSCKTKSVNELDKNEGHEHCHTMEQ